MKYHHCLFILIFILAQSVAAQRDRGTVRLGMAFANFKIESVNSAAIYGEYSKAFAGPVSITFGGSFASFDAPVAATATNKKQTFSVHLNGAYNVIDNDWQQLFLGAGVSGRYFNESWALDGDAVLAVAEFKPGFLLVSGYDFKFNETWRAGARISGEFFGNKNTVLLLGAHLGYHF